MKSRSYLFFKNTSANIFFFIFNALLGLIVTPLFLKNMGADLYGIWLLNFAIMNYFLFLNSSLTGGIVRNVSESLNGKGDLKRITTINVSLAIYLLVGLFVWGVLHFGVDFVISFFKVDVNHAELLKQMVLISAGFAVIVWPLKVFEAVFLGLLQHTTLNVVKGLVSAITSISMIIMLEYHAELKDLIVAYYGLSLMVGLVLCFIYFRRYPVYHFRWTDFTKEHVKPILEFSFNLMILEIISMLAFQVDTFVIAYFLPLSFIAVYGVVTKLFYILQGVYGAMLSVVQPMIFKAVDDGDQVFIHKVALKGFKYVLIFYVPLIIIASELVEPFLDLWVGQEFSQYAIWGSIFLLQYMISPAVGVLGVISIGMSKLRYIQIYGSFSALSNFGLSVFLVQQYGFQGVILGTVLTTFFGVMVIYPYYCHAIGLDWKLPIKENYKEFTSLLFFLGVGMVCVQHIQIDSWVLLLSVGSLFLMVLYSWMFFVFGYREDKNKMYSVVQSFKIAS